MIKFLLTSTFYVYLGIFTRSTGDKYEGEWKDDKKEGKGTIFLGIFSYF